MTGERSVETSANRKDDHVRLATDQAAYRHGRSDFDDLTFIHHALRAADVERVTTETVVLGRKWSSPIYINAMTGGSVATGTINEQLARVAHATGVTIASGSMSHLLKDASSIETFRVLRTLNPNGVVFANLSANASLDDAHRVIDAIEADAIQIHINSVQEIVMPEGDRTFSHWSQRIETLVNGLSVPVIIKEVGFGLSAETVYELVDLGVQAVDVSGRGGTNFAKIENDRRVGKDYRELATWGQSTVTSLLDVALPTTQHGTALFASGGVRNPLDVAKALALGAGAVGVAGGFLHTLQREGEDALIAEIHGWQEQLQAIQALLGAPTPAKLQDSTLVITGAVREFAELRGIDVASYAKRGSSTHRRKHG